MLCGGGLCVPVPCIFPLLRCFTLTVCCFFLPLTYRLLSKFYGSGSKRCPWSKGRIFRIFCDWLDRDQSASNRAETLIYFVRMSATATKLLMKKAKKDVQANRRWLLKTHWVNFKFPRIISSLTVWLMHRVFVKCRNGNGSCNCKLCNSVCLNSALEAENTSRYTLH